MNVCLTLLKKEKNNKDKHLAYNPSLLRYVFPLFTLISYWLFFIDSGRINNMIDGLSTFQIVLISTLIAIVLSTVFTGIYKLTNWILYGKQLKKLDNMIEELSQLEN